MRRRIIARSGIAIAAVVAASACQSAPDIAPQAVDPCATITSGPAAYQPPFPDGCAPVMDDPNGLRWIEISAGPDGKASPKPGARIVVSYQAYLASDGTEVDSSYGRGEPSVFTLGELIQGWNEILLKMTPGDEWLAYIPSALAYGASSPGGGIPPNADLVFRIKLEGFINADDAEVAGNGGALGADDALWAAFLPWDGEKEGVKTLSSGLSYFVIESGGAEGKQVTADDMVALDYEARVNDTGKVVGTTWQSETPLQVQAGNLIPGFAQALTLMQPGDIWMAHIPARIAYGKAGLGEAIPPNADLVYLINLIAVNPKTPG